MATIKEWGKQHGYSLAKAYRFASKGRLATAVKSKCGWVVDLDDTPIPITPQGWENSTATMKEWAEQHGYSRARAYQFASEGRLSTAVKSRSGWKGNLDDMPIPTMLHKRDEDKYREDGKVTLAEWASKHKVTKGSVIYHIQNKRFATATKEGGRWYVHPDDTPLLHSRIKNDMIGRTFGELTVRKLADERRKRQVVYICDCSCGKTDLRMTRNALVTGNTKSCGHLGHPKTGPRIDLSGHRYGRLIVQTATNKQISKMICWVVRCDCGTHRICVGHNLRQGRNRSCGCLSSRNGQSYARCPSCGTKFPIVLDGSPTPQFCPDCAPSYVEQWNVCPICKKLFTAPNDEITCSSACEAIWREKLGPT